MNNFSPNMLKTFEECEKKFFLKYIQKVSLPQRSAIFEKGKKIHALANYYLNGFDISKMEKTLSMDEKATWESLKSNKYFQLDVVNTEYSLTCKVGNYWIGGRLDALMNDARWKMENVKRGLEDWKVRGLAVVSQSETTICSQLTTNSSQTKQNLQPSNPLNLLPLNYLILDYKTGNIPQNAENDFQTITYLLCADKFLNKKGGYETLKFVYLGLKKDEIKEITLTPELKSEYEQKIISVCDKIKTTIASSVTKNNIPNCTKCEYHKLCQVL